MGLSPRELAELTPFQFELKCKGFKARDIDIENYFRKLAYINYAIASDPKADKYSIDDIWPNANTVVKAKERIKLTKNRVQNVLEWAAKKGMK